MSKNFFAPLESFGSKLTRIRNHKFLIRFIFSIFFLMILLFGFLFFSLKDPEKIEVKASPGCENKSGGSCALCGTGTTCNNCSGAGCSWDAAGPCSGTNTFNCSQYNGLEESCLGLGNACCSWNASKGWCVKKLCSSLGAEGACSICGCSWDPADCYGTLNCTSYLGQPTCEGCSQCQFVGIPIPLPLGSLCTVGSECASTYCVDNYCCNSACGGTCQTCAATPGTCTTRLSNDDVECGTCQRCDGSNTSCQLVTADSGKNCTTNCYDCVGGTCSATSENNDGTCTQQCTKCSSGSCISRSADDNFECATCQRCDGTPLAMCAAVISGQEGKNCTAICKQCDGASNCASINNAEDTVGSTTCSGGCKYCSAGSCTTVACIEETIGTPCSITNVCNNAGSCVLKTANGGLCTVGTCTACSPSTGCIFCTSGYCISSAVCGIGCSLNTSGNFTISSTCNLFGGNHLSGGDLTIASGGILNVTSGASLTIDIGHKISISTGGEIRMTDVNNTGYIFIQH